MANPNIVAVTNINGKTAVATISSTPTTLLENTSSSNKVFKINMMIVANKHTDVIKFDASLRRASVDYNLAYQVSLPKQSSLDLVSKSIYLQEGDSIVVSSDINNVSTVVCSYEEIS